jgi:glutamine cyclotransferase
MKEKYIQILGIAIVLVGSAFITFLYWSEPRSFAEVATKGQVVIGTYTIDQAEFERGLAAFRSQDFAGSRAAFDRCDPEKKDANVQFYVAYSYYRQGWGLVSNDDQLFSLGAAAVARVIAIDPNFRSTDPSLQMRTASELKTEIDEGLKITPSDFNPMKLTRERK